MNKQTYKTRKPLPKSVVLAKRCIEICVDRNMPGEVRLTISMCAKMWRPMLRAHAGECWAKWVARPE